MHLNESDDDPKRTGATDAGRAPSTDGTIPLEVPVFFNPAGAGRIEIGVSSFDCVGLLPPHDHPHVYLNIGEQGDVRCPYCSTKYRLNAGLRWNETIPPGCWVVPA